MEPSLTMEFWIILQIALDSGLILLFLYLLRRRSQERTPTEILNAEDLIGIMEPVLSEARAVAEAFDGQLKEKQRIIKKLNTQLDSRIISMNLLLNRAEARWIEPENRSADDQNPPPVYKIQHEILSLSEEGLTLEEIAARLHVPKGEVTLVLQLKKNFLEMEQ